MRACVRVFTIMRVHVWGGAHATVPPSPPPAPQSLKPPMLLPFGPTPADGLQAHTVFGEFWKRRGACEFTTDEYGTR
jgi:hypothetical protein